MQLEDWLDDLCVRFIINLPPEELASVERICFQVEEAQWFYEDFIRPLDPSLPSLPLKAFSLRIFQHCPLFSTWSTHHYTSAFAEFLAYKQRVPVRGAIMLNEEMDEVVLVKGWKKGANWSFPRGKINKDENDLDCAVREVYEETGYDIQAAGLVKAEKDMKYIEITMREQHMRLYVFRGVSKATHFEPKTRKEISKIEWYKLTDLPTLKKKHTHHDGQDENAALNANKFYMVAPFLHPLKKWIAQQKKKENRYSSSHLAAPPMFIDESATEGEPGPTSYADFVPQVLSPPLPSSLPEVATNKPFAVQDPTAHLKELLSIGLTAQKQQKAPESTFASNTDTVKANALLALLRNGSTTDAAGPTPNQFDHQSGQAHYAVSSDRSTPGWNTIVEMIEPLSGATAALQPQLPSQQRSLLDLFTNVNVGKSKLQEMPSSSEPQFSMHQQPPSQSNAPYQRTRDPYLSGDSPEETRSQVIPPADALPKMTQHTRTLLDAFKAPPYSPSWATDHVTKPDPISIGSKQQVLLDAFKSQDHNVQSEPKASTSGQSDNRNTPHTTSQAQTKLGVSAKSSNASDLLSLFKLHDIGPKVPTPLSQKAAIPEAPVELAAAPVTSPKPQVPTPQTELLSNVLRRDAPKRTPQATRAGETAATIDGPLNQPHFEGLGKSPSQMTASDSLRRSPVPAHRTLYDPRQPTPTKILQRSDDSHKRVQPKSPRPPKISTAVISPKQKPRSKGEKPFQPQILKRPLVVESRDDVVSSPSLIEPPDDIRKRASPISIPTITPPFPALPPSASPVPSLDVSRRASAQMESQKQNLLSLLTGQGSTTGTGKPIRQSSTPGPVSPLTQSQVMSPVGEDLPISTRSRMGSLVSLASPVPGQEHRPKPEKRQTAANDKAFLLGYLGRIASEEGQAQQ